MPGRASVRDAALVSGFAGHYDDFDDTHLGTVIHPSAACFGAAWAIGWSGEVTGDDLLRAFAIGCEAQLRLGEAVCPEHYDRGWHITGTCGVVGATVTAALLRGLRGQTLAASIAIACVRTLGHREGFGSETKPLHAGLAAAAGVEITDEAPGFAERHADWRMGADPLALLLEAFAPGAADHGLLAREWGVDTPWELEYNAFKPYPCGIVAHPGIDAGVAVGEQLVGAGVSTKSIRVVRYRAHPLVEELMGRVDPETSLEARFSARHGVAVGLRHRAAGIAEFEETVAVDDEIRRIRFATEVITDASLRRDEAEVSVELEDGTVLRHHIAHARGSAARPLTDDEVRAKAAVLLGFARTPGIRAVESTVTALHGSDNHPWRSLGLDAEEVAR
ncbi:hypothetical protein ASD93_11365 [Microbacterium sp. Root180]|nr:hypothetical protein ASD93_11365 [Microbacterium sp. Root180]